MASDVVTAAVDAAWLDESLDDAREAALAVGQRLAAGQGRPDDLEKLSELASLAESLDGEIENAEKTLAEGTLRKQIEDQLEVVRATAEALADA